MEIKEREKKGIKINRERVKREGNKWRKRKKEGERVRERDI